MNYPKTSSTSQKRLSKGDKWKKPRKTKGRINKSLLILEPLMFDIASNGCPYRGKPTEGAVYLLSEYGNPECQRILVREYFTPKLHKRMLVGRFVNQFWAWDNCHRFWVHLRTAKSLCPAMKAMYIREAYPIVNIQGGKDGKKLNETIRCHRLMAAVWCPNDDPEHRTQVDHLNGDLDDYSQFNLEWVTPEENIRRAVAMRRARKELQADKQPLTPTKTKRTASYETATKSPTKRYATKTTSSP